MNDRDPEAARAADAILETPLRVELSPRHIGKLLGLLQGAKDELRGFEGTEYALELEDISERLTRAVAQIGARP